MKDHLERMALALSWKRERAIRKAQQAVRDLEGGYVPITHEDSDEGALTVC